MNQAFFVFELCIFKGFIGFDYYLRLNFRAYHKDSKIKHLKLRLTQKAETLLHLIRIVHNRAFHFENLDKLNRNNPRLNIKVKFKGKKLYFIA